MEWVCLSAHPQGVALRLRVSPKAARTAAGGLRLDRLSLRVKAPPVEGQANEETRRWAAKAFNTRPSRVRILRGEHARDKDLLLEGVSLEEAGRILAGMLSGNP